MSIIPRRWRRYKYTLITAAILMVALAIIIARYMLLAHYHYPWWLL